MDPLDDALEGLLGGALDLCVKREDHVGAALRVDGRGAVEDAAIGVHVDGLLAADALEHAFVLPLDARLAHDVAGTVFYAVGIAGVLAPLELLLADRAGVAQDVSRKAAVGIEALGALLDLDAHEEVGVLVDIGDHTPRHVDGDRALALGALVLALDLATYGKVGHADEVGKQLHLDLVVNDLGIGRDGKAGTVGHELDAVAVEDATAGSGRRDGAGAVGLGLLLVVV